jgi:hypothetical protein
MTLHAKGIAIAVPIHFYFFISIAYGFYRFFKLIKSNSFSPQPDIAPSVCDFFCQSETVTVLIFFFIRFMFMPVLFKSV